MQDVKFWIPTKWSGKSSMEIIQKCHYQFSGKSQGKKLLWYVGWSCI